MTGAKAVPSKALLGIQYHGQVFSSLFTDLSTSAQAEGEPTLLPIVPEVGLVRKEVGGIMGKGEQVQ